jgi:two-component system sensor kinase FixL
LNAMDALKNKANGERVISIRAAETTDDGIEISVSDSCELIALDKIDDVFEHFFTTKPAGLGMGLAISKTIVEAHGGKIRAQNNTTRGATFHFTLPGHRS